MHASDLVHGSRTAAVAPTEASKDEELLPSTSMTFGGNRQLAAFIVHTSMAWLRLRQAHVEVEANSAFVAGMARPTSGRRMDARIVLAE
jgi:hypothetical protein